MTAAAAADPEAPAGHLVVALARAWIGTPYVHQASVKGAGADCLGLVRGIWRELRGCEPEALPPYTPDWSETDRRERLLAAASRHLDPVAMAQSAPGDILVFRMVGRGVAKHLGILALQARAQTIVHAYSGHGVVESPLTPAWRRRIAGAYRFPVRRH